MRDKTEWLSQTSVTEGVAEVPCPDALWLGGAQQAGVASQAGGMTAGDGEGVMRVENWRLRVKFPGLPPICSNEKSEFSA